MESSGSEVISKLESDRRAFLTTCGKYAITVPPVMTVLLSTTLSSPAIAKSGGDGRSGVGSSGGGDSGGGAKGEDGGGTNPEPRPSGDRSPDGGRATSPDKSGDGARRR